MKPESVLSLPLRQVPFSKTLISESTHDTIAETYTSDVAGALERASALVAMCNAYPLALVLARECEIELGLAEPPPGGPYNRGPLLRAALAAFLAHRTPAQHDEKGGEQ